MLDIHIYNSTNISLYTCVSYIDYTIIYSNIKIIHMTDKTKDSSAFIDGTEDLVESNKWAEERRKAREEKEIKEKLASTSSSKSRTSAKKVKEDREEYTERFLADCKIKDYTPVYIDVHMKAKLQTLVASLKHIKPEITPSILLSNILADHLSENCELITKVANEGLKRSLTDTFKNDKK